MSISAPTVMVSSTCYDLGQIRADVGDFLAGEMGYRALLSEFPSFPIDPDQGIIENCRRRVENEADILILVIGGRYGSVDSRSSKSVTNLEYLSARRKGIPIYAFIEKRVLPLISVWRANPEADFSASVDDPRLFQFIENVRATDGVWTREFENAGDVISSLRHQFAHLTKSAIRWSRRLNGSSDHDSLESLRGEALRLALELPEHWEIQLLGQVLGDGIRSLRYVERENELNIAIGPSEIVATEYFFDWARARMNELYLLATGIDKLLNTACKEAMGDSGAPGDLDYIVFVGKHLVFAYRESLEWVARVRRAWVPDIFRIAHRKMEAWASQMIQRTRDFSLGFSAQVQSALDADARGETGEVRIHLDIGTFEVDDFLRELDRLHDSGYE